MKWREGGCCGTVRKEVRLEHSNERRNSRRIKEVMEEGNRPGEILWVTS